MATRKKTVPETETVVKAVPVAAEKKAMKSAKANSPAATHKNPSRKAAARKAPLKAEAQLPATLTFDAAAHHDEIAHEAYILFINRGAQHGHDHEDWLRAVEIVKARYQG